MTINLYDTYARKTREFTPIDPGGKIGIYCCGPTVYNFVHIGNLRTYVFEDVLRRVIESDGHDVHHVVNITDVGHLVSDADDGEDKMDAGSARTGKTAWEIAQIYTDAFLEDLVHLNIKMPHVLCKATDHIEEQIASIKQIEEKGLIYITSDGVYFNTQLDPDYGYLARLDVDGLNAGARVDTGEKRSVTDFALWKFSPPDSQRQMEWESPWGKGFPGWHIECSAMAAKYLGPLFDIHCGGKDHIPIHHSNEIAQSQACYGTRLANYWMHGYFLQADAGKMSKSSGDFLRVQTLIDKGYDPLAFRFLCLLAHYRSDISFSWETLDSAVTALNRLRAAFVSWPDNGEPDVDYQTRFMASVNDDLNTSKGIAIVWELLKSDVSAANKKATLLQFDEILGLQLASWEPKTEDIPAAILQLAEQREQARLQKDWAAADTARDELAKQGYQVVDTPDGPMVKSIE